MISDDEADQLVNEIVATGRYRVLRRLDLNRRPCIAPAEGETAIGVVIDCETTSLDTARCKVIQLSLRRFRYDGLGRITKLDVPYSWLEDPGEPISPEISRLTALTDDDLRGRTIDDEAACDLIASATVRIGFNASFDRKIVERRLPAVAALAWACAMREVEWRERGFDGSGRSLSWLLAQAGYFHEAHRADADVDATIALLAHRSADGVIALAELLAKASRPGWIFSAVGADFSVKEQLRLRNYRWDADGKVWWREVADGAREDEEAWLAANVYAPEHMPRMDRPLVREITWESRHG